MGESGELNPERIFNQFISSQQDFTNSVDKLSTAVEKLSEKFNGLQGEVKACKGCIVSKFSLYFGILLFVVTVLAMGREFAPAIMKFFKLI